MRNIITTIIQVLLMMFIMSYLMYFFEHHPTDCKPCTTVSEPK